ARAVRETSAEFARVGMGELQCPRGRRAGKRLLARADCDLDHRRKRDPDHRRKKTATFAGSLMPTSTPNGPPNRPLAISARANSTLCALMRGCPSLGSPANPGAVITTCAVDAYATACDSS